MNTKLTLSIEKQVIQEAKAYAKKEGRSLSNIIEEYLKSISKNRAPQEDNGFHPLVDELCGSVKITENKSYDEILGEAIIEKYSKR